MISVNKDALQNSDAGNEESTNNSSKPSMQRTWEFDTNLLTRQLSTLLLVVVLLNVVSIASQLATWMMALLILCFVWRISLNQKKYTSANRFLLIGLALTGCVLLALNSKSLGLLLTMLHLLCFSYTLKMLEMRTRKDFYQLIFIGLFLLASSLIFMQSLAFFAYFIVALISNLGLLAQFFAPTVLAWQNSKKSLILILQSLPLALALFFLFPKLPPFWEVPFANNAKTGLSDSVSVGDVADLALSNEVAFRVTFKGEKPAFEQLYWRTLVLDEYAENTWRQRKLSVNPRTKKLNIGTRPSSQLNDLSGDAYQYRLIAEASFQRWLFALDVAKTENAEVFHKWDYSLVSSKPITQTTSYDVTSFFSEAIEPSLSERQKNWYLTLPENENPKLKALGEQLAKENTQKENRAQAIVERILSTFNQQQFHYTLQPPLLTGNVLDNFYFESKAGFCEHYASTFAYIMRAAGIHARLVVGYMGGEYNQQGKFYTVRQRDAHAWVEVWLEGEGWTRVDPTASVSPDRVENGFSDRLFQEQSSMSGDLLDLYQLTRIQWVSYLREQLANLDYQWTKWVVGYDAKRQFDMLKAFFGKDFQWKVGALVGASIILTMLLLAVIYRERKSKTDYARWQQWYFHLISLLAKKGYERNQSATPSQFLDDIKYILEANNKNTNNDIEPFLTAFSRFTQSYNTMAYGMLTDEKVQILNTVMKTQYKKCRVLLKKIN